MVKVTDVALADNGIEKEYANAVSIEHRKKYAQFFTPFAIARLMAGWLVGNKNISTVLDPAFGLGVFTRALMSYGVDLNIRGFEIDETILSKARWLFDDNENIEVWGEDYMRSDWDSKYDGIICNPPYFKFHDYDNKTIIREVEEQLNIKLNGFTNLYTLFLLKAIHQLKPGGRAAFITPSEFLNADYGKLVKSVLVDRKILRHIVVIDFEEKVFDDALTTACILLCSNDEHNEHVAFSSICSISELGKIEEYNTNYPHLVHIEQTCLLKDIDPQIKWRKYYQQQNAGRFKNLVPFANFARVVRGIATGANDYFTFSRSKASDRGISEMYLLPCICKAADVKSNFFTKENFQSLTDNDRQVFLLNAVGADDPKVAEYVMYGEETGIHKKYLTASRNPWYALENRPPAPVWVSVFNRNGLKFIRNEANIANLTTFHCIYPVKSGLFESVSIDLLFACLLTDAVRMIFEDNRREYGNGLQKFEPNDLNNALMPDLSLLDGPTRSTILDLYYRYRTSVINALPDDTLLTGINEILKEQYYTDGH